MRRAYPRAGGGTGPRGTRRLQLIQGPIPAQAGEPRRRRTVGARVLAWAYPRAGGGTVRLFDLCGSGEGRRAYPRAGGGTFGIHGEGGARIGAGAYPRAGGGTSRPPEMHTIDAPSGLSPRRRGNQLSDGAAIAIDNWRPIPAQAGEPDVDLSSRRRVRWRAYPRAGWGNRSLRSVGCSTALRGPIPAQAGEPSCSARHRRRDSLQGLSPRRRGNRLTAPPAGGNVMPRPIPAQAGEPGPSHTATARNPQRAYPRAGGGTSDKRCRRNGARSWKAYPRAGGGTFVPVSAPSGATSRAYPRAGGGTASGVSRQCTITEPGLSPRRRGNRIYDDCRDPGQISGLSPRRRGNLRDRGAAMSACYGGLSPRRRGNRSAF